MEKKDCYNCTYNTDQSLRGGKLRVMSWLDDIPLSNLYPAIVEVQFKNKRKEFFSNINGLRLAKGDTVAVESSPGHDIGKVSIVGELVFEQMRKLDIDYKKIDFKKIYRHAQYRDFEKWERAIELEMPTLIKTRKIIKDLKLDMKLSDVEYQGDKLKAYFYYIADERVDFRELIKILAREFKVRVEMRQIGSRQEAGLVGGIGACGRELCCSSWINNFVSISTNAARAQEIPVNPQKLAGQCAKLKCCLNYELDSYKDAKKEFPLINIPLKTEKGKAYHVKTDVYKRIMWFSQEGEKDASKLIPLDVKKVKEIISLNEKGILVDALAQSKTDEINDDYISEERDLTKLPRKKSKKKRRKKNRKR